MCGKGNLGKTKPNQDVSSFNKKDTEDLMIKEAELLILVLRPV